jgi:hypothetical protein
VGGGHGRPLGGGLRAHRGVPRHPLQSPVRHAEAGQHRGPRAGHGRPGGGPRDGGAAGAGGGRRASGPRAPGDAGLPEPPGGDRASPAGRVAAHRGHGPHGRGRLLLRGGPEGRRR